MTERKTGFFQILIFSGVLFALSFSLAFADEPIASPAPNAPKDQGRADRPVDRDDIDTDLEETVPAPEPKPLRPRRHPRQVPQGPAQGQKEKLEVDPD